MKLERTYRHASGELRPYKMSPEAAERNYQATRKCHARTYDRLTVDVPKGMVEALTEIAQRRGVPRRQLLIELFRREIEKESAGF